MTAAAATSEVHVLTKNPSFANDVCISPSPCFFWQNFNSCLGCLFPLSKRLSGNWDELGTPKIHQNPIFPLQLPYTGVSLGYHNLTLQNWLSTPRTLVCSTRSTWVSDWDVFVLAFTVASSQFQASWRAKKSYLAESGKITATIIIIIISITFITFIMFIMFTMFIMFIMFVMFIMFIMFIMFMIIIIITININFITT
jgi:hypothetical protein